MDRFRRTLLHVRDENRLRARMVHWYGGPFIPFRPNERVLTDHRSGIFPRNLSSQPLPRLHLTEIRPLSRSRHGYGRRRARRTIILSPHKERPRV